MRTPENIVRHELIGLKVKVFKAVGEKRSARDRGPKVATGKVVNETRNTLQIEVEEKGNKTVKKYIKENFIFVFSLKNQTEVEVDGRLLKGRPEERLKKDFPQKWSIVTK